MVQTTLQIVYCIDSSALIDLWRVYYSPDVFPGIWKDLELSIKKGLIYAPREVYFELQERDDALFTWAKENNAMFVDLNEKELRAVRDVLKDHPNVIDSKKTTQAADPFVIALSMVRGWTLVTSEKASGDIGHPKIPDVCQRIGLKCIKVMDLFREQGWKYDR